MNSQFNKPNAWGLQGSDFDFEMDSYTIALGFLGDVSIGVAEEHALATNGGTPELMRSWQKSRRFRRELGKAREMGEAERRYAVEKAQRRSDPFSTPPRPGQVDLAAETFDPRADKPPGALSRFLRRLGVEIDWQHAQRDEPRPSGQRYIPISDLTPADAIAIGRQRDEAAARVQAEQAADGPQAPGPQAWDRKREHISPDGIGWQGAPGSGGGLFTSRGDPDSFPTP
jgi:hypothetical protein